MNFTSSLPRPRLFALAFLLLAGSLFAQKKTSVRGQIFDATSKESMPYISVQFEGTQVGAMSDIEGKFYLEMPGEATRLKVSSVGFQTQFVDLKPGQANVDVQVFLPDASMMLKEVVIGKTKYKNKGNPAVELIRKVIDHKEQNRRGDLDFLAYRRYEKLNFGLNNVTEKTKHNWLFKSVPFLFESADTNKVNGKVSLPLFLREQLADVYYRRLPKDQKTYIRAEQLTNLGGVLDIGGVSDYLTFWYQDVDIYENTLDLLTTNFISPLHPLSPNIYRFYIQDTLKTNAEPWVHLFFAPRQKTDLAFIGHMWVALDSTYSVRKIELGIPKQINLNWVNELQILQEFTPVLVDSTNPKSRRALMLSRDEIFLDIGLFKGDSTRTLLGIKTTTYGQFQLNKPLNEQLFRTNIERFEDDSVYLRDKSFWEKNRLTGLTKKEVGLYNAVDSMNRQPAFKNKVKLLQLIADGSLEKGVFTIGPVNSFLGYNSVEGWRPRFGGRTNDKLSKVFQLQGYVSYGFKDEKWKVTSDLHINLGKGRPNRFPLNEFKLTYSNNLEIPGNELFPVSEDNILNSIKRGRTDKMFFIRAMRLGYKKESKLGFTYEFSVKNMRYRPAGVLRFEYERADTLARLPQFSATELGAHFRYSPNERFYEGTNKRRSIASEYPTWDLFYTAGVKDLLDGQYDYHALNLRYEQYLYVPPLGHMRVIAQAGRVFGQVPYPLLRVHRANQTYSFQQESYNLMNFREFVSDKYAGFEFDHNFEGWFFGRVPLLKRLHWRENMTLKALWGGLDAGNRPTATNGLLHFPTDEQGNLLTYTLEKQPYLEAGVGINNILKFIRVDYIRRLTYLSNPGVPAWGIRARLRFDF